MAAVSCPVLTPSGWFHYNIGGSWARGLNATNGGPFFDLPRYEILNMSHLPPDSYTFYLGVDMDMNGIPDLYQMH